MSSHIIPKERKEDKKEKNLVQIYNYMAWTFIILILLDFIVIIFQEINYFNLALLYLFFIFAALCFSAAAYTKSDPIEKRNSFKYFMISAAAVGILTIFVLSAYQW